MKPNGVADKIVAAGIYCVYALLVIAFLFIVLMDGLHRAGYAGP